MALKRVVITGLGVVSPFGNGVAALMSGLAAGRSAVRRMAGWEEYVGLQSLVGAPVEMIDEKRIPRQKRRSMGRMSIFAAQAADEALLDAGLDLAGEDRWRVGCVIGSTMGSAKSINDAFELMLPDKDLGRLNSTQFFQCMSHTAAVNVAQYLEINGTIMAPAAACASALHAIGTGRDLIRLGRQDVLLCGGAEELHPTVTGSFDILMATSAGYNDRPELTPRPFDRDRDGLVCGEGCALVVLEDYDRAVRRGAKIYAEITGFCTNANGLHVSQSNRESMVVCMRQALAEAGIAPAEVDYINAHATATLQGDQEEAEAIRDVFGAGVPVSSLKGYFGHTLGASGSIELAAALKMMENGLIHPTLHLDNVADDCAGIRHVTAPIKGELRTIVKNGFAFGGINATLVCRKVAG
ncbi:MAG: beta-ketoacyl-[acyl-carrier-protein] synthase family protein [Deltaproteobacteria bacterium]|nr:MAG: beta-ketoacyl-[acyl-carrier-protein] synthase family protein [Deltaproteobacteria bacterium]